MRSPSSASTAPRRGSLSAARRAHQPPPRDASLLLARVLEGASLKSLCHSHRPTYALLNEAIKRLPLLSRALAASGWDGPWRGQEFAHAIILVHDLLFGVGLRRSRAARTAPRAIRTRLLRWQAELIRAAKARAAEPRTAGGDSFDKDSADIAAGSDDAPRLPRYARVNTLVASIDDVVASLRREGFDVVAAPSATPIEGPAAATLWRDAHIAPLLVLPAGCELHEHVMVASGALILQDKASCFTPAALAPPAGAVCIDCCAAPGNKTTQLAALVGVEGRVLAVERDAARAETLRRRVGLAHAANIAVGVADFLSIDPSGAPYADADCILLDPSCSGSGIVERSSRSVGRGAEEETGGSAGQEGGAERLRSLAALQLRLLLHALSFPRARRVAYSTCSVHPIENEVVALAAARDATARAAGWRLVRALPGWPCRGLPLAPQCELCLRSGPEWLTNGFFVACFERRV